jgi:uncharacterized protein (UPF0147 family)
MMTPWRMLLWIGSLLESMIQQETVPSNGAKKKAHQSMAFTEQMTHDPNMLIYAVCEEDFTFDDAKG